MVGIVSYGTYVPTYRIRLSDISNVWHGDNEAPNLQMSEKAVPGIDEDAITMAIEAGKKAIDSGKIDPTKIGCIYVGSESHPYAVNPSSSTVATYLQMGNNYMTVDLEFACKAGTAGMQIAAALITTKQINYGLIIGSDTAQGRPHDMLEYTAASAACAFLFGRKKNEIIADILMTSSYTSDTPDFWRRDGARYPTHFNRFTGEPAYFTHIFSEAKKLFEKSTLKPEDFSYCVFHMPNGKFPRIIAKKLGFTPKQLAPSLVVDKIGNSYSASSLLGLAAVLDIAKPKEKIFFVSYGSGAGADGFIFETGPAIKKIQKKTIPLKHQISIKRYLSYPGYLKHVHIL